MYILWQKKNFFYFFSFFLLTLFFESYGSSQKDADVPNKVKPQYPFDTIDRINKLNLSTSDKPKDGGGNGRSPLKKICKGFLTVVTSPFNTIKSTIEREWQIIYNGFLTDCRGRYMLGKDGALAENELQEFTALDKKVPVVKNMAVSAIVKAAFLLSGDFVLGKLEATKYGQLFTKNPFSATLLFTTESMFMRWVAEKAFLVCPGCEFAKIKSDDGNLPTDCVRRRIVQSYYGDAQYENDMRGAPAKKNALQGAVEKFQNSCISIGFGTACLFDFLISTVQNRNQFSGLSVNGLFRYVAGAGILMTQNWLLFFSEGKIKKPLIDLLENKKQGLSHNSRAKCLRAAISTIQKLLLTSVSVGSCHAWSGYNVFNMGPLMEKNPQWRWPILAVVSKFLKKEFLANLLNESIKSDRSNYHGGVFNHASLLWM